MKAKEIQDLINFLSDTGLEEVNIETEDFKVSIKMTAYSCSLKPVYLSDAVAL